jgi:tetratricopeptide (TPR) repeat protein
MVDYRTASLRHAAYYVQVLYTLNANYLHGAEEQVDSLRNFDIELPNVLLARDKLPGLIAPINAKQEISEIDRSLLDICNTFPDAGAYLISVKLNALERIQWLKDSLLASQKLENNITTQAHLGNLGLAYYELGDLSQATEYFLRAFKLAEQIGDKYHQGAWLGNLGNIYAMTGDHEKAIEYHKRHLGLAQEINDVRGEGHALANLGVSFAYLGDVAHALENYKQFLKLAIKSGDRHEESQALINLGFAYYDVGDLESASNSFQSAWTITIELGDKLTQVLVMDGLADVQIDRGEYQAAIQTLQEAFNVLKETRDVGAELRLLQSLGNAYSASDDYQNALDVYSRQFALAESVGAKAGMCSALANQTSIYRHIGNLDYALEMGKKGLELAKIIKSLTDEAIIHWQFGLIYEERLEKKKAIVEMNKAIEFENKIASLEIEKHRKHLQNMILHQK